MVPWLIQISESDVADDTPLKAGTTKFKYDPATNRGVLRENILRIEIYGQDFDAVLRGLLAYDMMRVGPVEGKYDEKVYERVKHDAWELAKKQLKDFIDPRKLATQMKNGREGNDKSNNQPNRALENNH
jgi:hypothetical protein